MSVMFVYMEHSNPTGVVTWGSAARDSPFGLSIPFSLKSFNATQKFGFFIAIFPHILLFLGMSNKGAVVRRRMSEGNTCMEKPS